MTAAERIRKARAGLRVVPPRLTSQGFTPWAVYRGSEFYAAFKTYESAARYVENPLRPIQ